MEQYNDVFHQKKNRIPYNVEDATEAFGKGESPAVGRSALKAVSETAHTFMMEVTSKPFTLVNQRPTLPRIFMSNIKDKFPDLTDDA